MKIRVLIVEDDKYFRGAVKKIIDWEKYGLEVTGEAVHGAAALELLEKQNVEIVVTDMSMPIMNGIELTAAIKERYPEIMVIALSAYDDFEFVKESLRLGAADYILKQNIDNEDAAEKIVSAWEKHVERMLREGSIKEKIKKWMQGAEPTAEVGLQYISYYLHQQGWYLCAVNNLYSEWKNEECSRSKWLTESLMELHDKDEHVFFLPAGNTLSEAARIEYRNKMLGEISRIVETESFVGGCSSVGREAVQIPEKYSQVQELMERGRFQKKQKILLWDDARQIHRELGFEEEKETYQNVNTLEGAKQALDELTEKLRLVMPDEGHLQNNYLLLLHCVVSNLGYEMDKMEFANIKQQLAEESLLEDKCRFVDRYLEEFFEKREKENWHTAVFQTIGYMRENCERELTLEEIAARVSMNESYISNLFKRETGLTIIEYLNNIRIEKAKDLIGRTNLKNYEIGDAVGIPNASYFSTLFKKKTGFTIREYRRIYKK